LRRDLFEVFNFTSLQGGTRATMSTVRLRRLQADYEKVRDYVNRHPRLQLIQADGTPPERYQVEYRIRGLRQTADELASVKSHMVEISLPLSYPRMPPQCRMLTPIFHPNIAPQAICIGDHWSPGEPLWSIIARIGEMISFQSYNTKSPLNGEAARWVDQHLDELPLDSVSMMPDDAVTTGPPPPAVPDPAARPIPRPPVMADASATMGILPPAAPDERRIGCPQCGATLRFKPELAGRQVRCLRCRCVFRVPSNE
jgi:ubiquitin-protein ligase